MQVANKITKQIMRIQRTLLNNTFEAQTLWQEQGARTTRTILDQAVWMPEAGRRLWECWSDDLKTGRTTFQSLMNAHLDMMDGILAPLDTES